ncbi:hypothetical protein GGI12_005370 [Dipsacomyces acuminosporus]|nr:hypothetical protein GGI12_005370 [Dipsacomyces acuminosporus]
MQINILPFIASLAPVYAAFGAINQPEAATLTLTSPLMAVTSFAPFASIVASKVSSTHPASMDSKKPKASSTDGHSKQTTSASVSVSVSTTNVFRTTPAPSHAPPPALAESGVHSAGDIGKAESLSFGFRPEDEMAWMGVGEGSMAPEAVGWGMDLMNSLPFGDASSPILATKESKTMKPKPPSTSTPAGPSTTVAQPKDWLFGNAAVATPTSSPHTVSAETSSMPSGNAMSMPMDPESSATAASSSGSAATSSRSRLFGIFKSNEVASQTSASSKATSSPARSMIASDADVAAEMSSQPTAATSAEPAPPSPSSSSSRSRIFGIFKSNEIAAKTSPAPSASSSHATVSSGDAMGMGTGMGTGMGMGFGLETSATAVTVSTSSASAPMSAESSSSRSKLFGIFKSNDIMSQVAALPSATSAGMMPGGPSNVPSGNAMLEPMEPQPLIAQASTTAAFVATSAPAEKPLPPKQSGTPRSSSHASETLPPLIITTSGPAMFSEKPSSSKLPGNLMTSAPAIEIPPAIAATDGQAIIGEKSSSRSSASSKSRSSSSQISMTPTGTAPRSSATVSTQLPALQLPGASKSNSDDFLAAASLVFSTGAPILEPAPVATAVSDAELAPMVAEASANWPGVVSSSSGGPMLSAPTLVSAADFMSQGAASTSSHSSKVITTLPVTTPATTPAAAATTASPASSAHASQEPISSKSRGNEVPIENIPMNGDGQQPCRTGMLRCTSDGLAFDTCVHGRWGIIRTCSKGTNCVSVTENTIACA